MGLNLFRYGNHHNELIETADMLDIKKRPDVSRWITQYQWTPETVTGSESGRAARVWVHRGE